MRLIKIFRTISLALSISLTIGTTLAAQDLLTYTGEKIQVQYPSDWRLDASKSMGPVIFFYSPLSADDNEFQENVNVLFQDLSDNPLSLKAYTALTKAQIKDIGGEILRVEQTKKTADGVPEAIYEYKAQQFGMDLHFLQRVKIKDDQAYLLTYTATEDTFQQYFKQARSIVMSFQFTNGTNAGE